MATSQNGWQVLEIPPPPVAIPGASIQLRIRPGAVATVLAHVASRFHREVEPLTLPVTEKPGRDDWGWAYRPIRGQTQGYSNHASGTAIDLNATRHPRGVHGTFTPRQKATVELILHDTRDPETGRPVVRWGENYTTTVDGMHFEINAAAPAVSRAASRIRAAYAADARDLLELLMGLDPKDRAAFIADVARASADATLAAITTRPVPIMDYYGKLLDRPDDDVPAPKEQPLGITVQHAAAQSMAGVQMLKGITSGLAQVHADVETLATLADDQERAELAADIAARVDQLRVIVERVAPAP